VDFTAPPDKELSYRVLAVDAADANKGASPVTEPVSLSRTNASSRNRSSDASRLSSDFWA